MKNKIYVCCDACACSLRGFCSIHTLDLHVRQRLFGFLKKSLLSAGDEANINETQPRGGDICEKENNCGNPVAPAAGRRLCTAGLCQFRPAALERHGRYRRGRDGSSIIRIRTASLPIPGKSRRNTPSVIPPTIRSRPRWFSRSVILHITENTSMTKQRVGRSMFPTP